jgi:hypothetical protein
MIEDQSVSYDDINGWAAFQGGAKRLTPDGSRGITALNEFMCQFFRCLRPVITQTAIFRKLYDGVFEKSGITLTSQLRIEKDWIRYSNEDLKALENSGEDYLPSFQRILEKIKNTFSDQCTMIYIVCDEANLPTTKDEIKRDVYGRYQIYPLWKSDILSADELSGLSLLDLSLIDFEMSVRSPNFVGVTRSTFSMMAAFESFSRKGDWLSNQYIYDAPGDVVLQRFDNGSTNSPAKATNRLLLRERLTPQSPDDCFWPMNLTAHISTYGDFTSSGPAIIGVRSGPLVCGVRGDPLKFIEGFEVTLGHNLPCEFEYKAKLDDGTWTHWSRPGTFVGSRGVGKKLRGFAARLTGPHAVNFECTCVGGFVGVPEPIFSGEEGECSNDKGAFLEAMQIIIRPSLSAG